MTTISAEKARNSFSELVSRTAYSKDRVLITRHGKKLAALVSVEDLELLEYVDQLEDELDAKDIEEGLKQVREGKTTPWEQVKKELNL